MQAAISDLDIKICNDIIVLYIVSLNTDNNNSVIASILFTDENVN